MKKGNLYYYFRSKEDILFACHQYSVDRLLSVLETVERGELAARAEAASADRRRSSTRSSTTCTAPHCSSTSRRSGRGTSGRRSPGATSSTAGVRRVIQQGVDWGVFDPKVDPKLLSFAMLGAVNWIPRWYSPDGPGELAGNRRPVCRLPHRRAPLDIIEAMSRVIPLTPAQPRIPKPDWLKVKAPGSPSYLRLKSIMRDLNLHTVCEEARCPNIGECWNHGTATFMILGDVCTRACSYCAVAHGRPAAVDTAEPARVADAIQQLDLNYVVITSVDRDDLKDGGASIFADTITETRKRAARLPDRSPDPRLQGRGGATARPCSTRGRTC